MSDPLSDLSAARRLATGADVFWASPPELNPTCADRDGFSELVSSYYKFYREEAADDVAFLAGRSKGTVAAEFGNEIYLLRTALQHTDNENAKRHYDRFVGKDPDWQTLGTALASRLRIALQSLAVEAIAISRDPRGRSEWRARAELDVEVVFSSVAFDLNRKFTAPNRNRMIQAVRKRLQVRGAVSDPTRTVQEFCVQEITANRLPLPVPYFEVLDYFDLLGRRDAVAVILLAYSVAALDSRLVGEQFLIRVNEAWTAANG